MIKLAIFDLDGTLLHTIPDIAENLNIMLEKYGYPTLSEKEVAKRVGNGAKNLVKQSIPITLNEEELKERLDFYNKIYTQSGSKKTALFDGIEELLVSLKEKGIKLAILTNKPQMTTDDVYKTYLQRFGFSKVVGASDTVKCKPDKTATENIIKELSIKKEEVVFIGDGETDVMTAINSGVLGIAVLWGYRDKEDLESAGAKVFAKTPKEVFNLIDGIK